MARKKATTADESAASSSSHAASSSSPASPASPSAAAAAPPPPPSSPVLSVSDLLSTRVLVLTLLAALLSLALEYVPAPIEPNEFAPEYELRTLTQQSQYLAKVASTANHDVLRRAESVLVNKALSAEDMAIAPDGERAFIGMRDGRVVFLTSDAQEQLTMHPFARTGELIASCGSLESEPRCGRPLGLVFAEAKHYTKYLARIPNAKLFSDTHVLLVADAYKGLVLMDAAGGKTVVFSTVGARPVKFLNALVVGKNGDVYVSDSSRRFHRNAVLMDNLEHMPTGRLLHFDPRKGRVTVLAKNLGFPNGLALVDDERALLVALNFQNKIGKFTFATKTMEDFAFLPGQPDNLWLAPRGTQQTDNVLFVGLVDLEPQWRRLLVEQVKVRKLISLVVPHSWIMSLVGRRSAFAIVDLTTGDVTDIYEDVTGHAKCISGVHRFGAYYYLPSWARDHLVRFPVTALD